MSAFVLDTLFAVASHFLHLGGQTWPPESVLQQAQCLLLALTSSCLNDIHSRLPLDEPWGPQTAKPPPICTSRGVVMVEGSLVGC